MTKKTENWDDIAADKKLLDTCWETVTTMSREHRRAYVEAAGISVNRIVKSVPGLAEAVATAKEQRRVRENVRKTKPQDGSACPMTAKPAQAAGEYVVDGDKLKVCLSSPVLPAMNRHTVTKVSARQGVRYTVTKDPLTGTTMAVFGAKPSDAAAVAKLTYASKAEYVGMDERLEDLLLAFRGKKKAGRLRRLRPVRHGMKLRTYNLRKIDAGVKSYGPVQNLGPSASPGPQANDTSNNPWWGLEE